jgi:hypothetical protein
LAQGASVRQYYGMALGASVRLAYFHANRLLKVPNVRFFISSILLIFMA